MKWIIAICSLCLIATFMMAQLPMGGSTFVAASGGGTPALVGSIFHGDNGGSGNTKTFSYTGATAGNAFVVVANATQTSCTSLSFSTNATGTAETINTFNNGLGFTGIYVLKNISSGNHTLTITANGCASSFVQGGGGQFSNIGTGTVADGTNGAIGVASPCNTGNVTTTKANELAVAGATGNVGATWTPGGSGTWTNGSSLDASDFNHWSYQPLSATQTNFNATFGFTGATTSFCLIGTIKGN